ncbi:MAG TPA: heme lyase CcmF/NrfE family subunit, partial [Pseudoxanthomonas sp.]|nr:heme lyase CcmF/NrfE family subunit [Pseudoxanthomonas sp.]
LIQLFLRTDLSVALVAANSHSAKPWLYKLAGTWGNHEGSMLLWVTILGLAGGAVALLERRLPERTLIATLAAQAAIAIGFYAFLLFASNPFERLNPAPVEGQGLNPLLQDPGLAFHPPTLYIGYVGISIAFSFAVGALITRDVGPAFARAMRPWVLGAWIMLTLGITAGSYWAYYELGWGGWWFWDPVENASFMPWLAGAALLHSQAVTEKRGSFAGWTLLLAIAAFSLSLLGAFLVRSGVLTSVHAFAADPSRGLFILAFLGVVIGGSLLLYVLRAPRLAQGAPFAASSRETLLLANNVLLASATGMVLLGTLYPLLADALGLGKISVGPPYFGLLFLLLMAPLVLLLPLGPLTRWQREEPARPLRMLAPWFVLALAAAALAFFTAPQGPWKTAAGVGAAAWVLLGTARFVWTRLVAKGSRFTLEMLGMTLAHAGVAMFLVGAMLVEAMNVQRELAMTPGQTHQMGRHGFRFEGVDSIAGPNYTSERGHVQVLRDGAPLVLLHPEKRAYASGGQVMTEAGIRPGLFGDIYVAIGESLGGDARAVRIHIKPFVRWIWFGAGLMALGGFVTAADRRFRPKPQDTK